MKRISLILLGAVLAPMTYLHSQSPAPAPTPVQQQGTPVQFVTISISTQLKSPITQVQAMKAANQATIDQQTKTLQALDELQKQAEELKVFGKRS